MKSDKRLDYERTHLIYLRPGKNNSGKEKGVKHKSLPKEENQTTIKRDKRKGSPKQEALQTN